MVSFTAEDISAILLTLKLAGIVTVLLLFISLPLAWWLATTRSRFKDVISALIALPLILPPSVIGFYLLIFLSPSGWLGGWIAHFNLSQLVFSFQGLVIASIIYSLPFVVQPIQNAMEAVPKSLLLAASSLRAGALDRFLTVVLPLSKTGILTAAVLGFAHTLGEFGIVLMIGGSIPGETKLISIQIYDYVETLEYAKAHLLAGTMLLFSFVVLFFLYAYVPCARPFSAAAGGR